MSNDAKLTVSLILNDAGFSKNLKSVNQELKDTENDLKNAGNKFDEFGNKIEKNAATSAALAQKYEVLGKKIALYEQEIEKTSTTLRELTDKHEESATATESARAEYQRLQDTFGATSNEAKQYKAELDNIEKRHKSLEGAILSTDNKFKSLSSSLNATRNDFFSTAEEIQRMESNLEQIGDSSNNVREMTGDFERLNSSIRDVNNNLERIETNTRLETAMDAVENLSDLLGDASRAVVDFGKESAKGFAGFERTVVSGVMKTDNGIQDLELAMSGLQQLGAEFPVTNEELAVSFDDLAASGYSTNEALGILKGSLNTSTATTEGLEQIVSSTSGAYAIFKDDVGSVADMQDVMAHAANLGKISFEELGKQLVKVGGNAGNLGMDITDVSAILAQLTNSGLGADAAGEKLNSMLRQLGAPSKEAKGELESLKVSVFDSTGKFRGFTTVMNELKTATAGMSEEQKNATLNTLFGADASSAASTFMKNGIEVTNEYGKTLKDTKGYVQELSDAIVANSQSAQALNDFEGAIDSLKSTIGQALGPVLQTVLPMISGIISAFNNASPAVQTVIISLAGIVSVVGLVLSVMAPMLMSITSLMTMFSGMGAAAATAGAATGGIGAVLAALSGPVGWAIAAIAALYLAYQTNFLGMREIVDGAFSAIKTIFEVTFKVLADIFDVFKNLFTGNWTGLWESVKKLLFDTLEALKVIYTTCWDWIITSIITLGINILGAIVTAFNYLLTGGKQVWESFKVWWAGAVNDPVGTIKGIGTALYDAGKGIITSLWDGLKSMWGQLQKWFEDKMEFIKNKVQFWKDKNAEISNGGGDSDASEVAAPSEIVRPKQSVSSVIAPSFALPQKSFVSGLEVPNSSSYINESVTSVGTIAENRKGTSSSTNEAVNQTLSATQRQNELLMQMISLMQQEKTTQVEINMDSKKVAKATAKHMNKELYNINKTL